MTKQQLIERRSAIRKEIARLDEKRSVELRDEKDRHYEYLREVYRRHADAVREIEKGSRMATLPLREELDRLSHEAPDDADRKI